jgi:pimeloyl-ACP methyl ester carboxylesterase
MDLAASASARAIRHSIFINAREVIYFEYPANDPNARTLVMIHGYRGNHRGLEAIAAGLSDFRVLIPDLPGFGESEQLEAIHSVENYASWLHSFARSLGLEHKFHLMGHSFGTLVVGYYGTKFSPLSVSLVNPVSSPALEGPQAALTRLTKFYYRLASLAPKTIGQWLLRSKIAVMVMSTVMAKTKVKTLRRWIHTQHLNNFSDFATVRVAAEGYEASISSNLAMFAPAVTAPVLVVAAELDDITDIKTQRSTTKSFPNAVLREIYGVGHLVHYEAPDKAATFIREFLENLK